jgi:hypothetical protein
VIFNTHALRLYLWLQRFESLDVDGNGKLEMCDIVDDVERFNKSVAAAQEDEKPTFGAVLSSLGNIIAHGTADEDEDEEENTSSHAHRHPHDVSSNKSTLELGKFDADGVSASKDKASSSSGSHPKQPHTQQSHSTNPFDLIRNLNIRFDDIFRDPNMPFGSSSSSGRDSKAAPSPTVISSQQQAKQSPSKETSNKPTVTGVPLLSLDSQSPLRPTKSYYTELPVLSPGPPPADQRPQGDFSHRTTSSSYDMDMRNSVDSGNLSIMTLSERHRRETRDLQDDGFNPVWPGEEPRKQVNFDPAVVIMSAPKSGGVNSSGNHLNPRSNVKMRQNGGTDADVGVKSSNFGVVFDL